MRKLTLVGMVVVMVLAALVSACVVRAWVPLPPPAPLVEVRAVAPGPGHVWIDGWWEWNSRWAWRHGYWAVPPHPRALWAPGHWDRGPRGWHWVRGRWR